MSYTLKEVKEVSFTREFAWKNITFMSGKLAPQADGAVRIIYQNTEILVTCVMNRNPDTEKDFLPLTIDFRDGYYAAGKIWGGPYRKREWRPTEMSTLYGRIVDRTLRPMFPKWLINDIVISITPISYDRINDMATLAIIGGSLAIMMAGIPFDWPVSGVRVWYKEGSMIDNPSFSEFENNGLNLLVSGKKWSINMIEMDGKEIIESEIEKSLVMAQSQIDKLCDLQLEFLEILAQ